MPISISMVLASTYLIFWNSSRRWNKTSHPKAAQLALNFLKLKDCLSREISVFKEIIVGEAKTVVTSLLHGTASLFTVPNILERFETACANGEECLFLLDEMNRLANLLSSSKNVLG
jgi:hypothetical protein